ncbi:hypothetical protein SAMN05216410_1412 [Sanguibacter gelidistatuariae]|uniref:Uncharacterized protein n=1 Tax=Sanguibacter gelidistatuariae TaxID=1814289 RepID=A0A1G6JTJ2_9MICO|nr:hypothetical protein [Sanguibacter gelidistatuariae]SDC22007.1 hypothetical protein SAMN05216410_1412 [Sanguibacter gelidistatuariae]
MARLFWVGTGVALTVVVVIKGRQIIHRYAPAAVVDRATATAAATGSALSDAATHFLSDFRAARDERARELADALLAPTQGSVEDLQARRRAYDADAARDDAGRHGPGRHADDSERATRARYAVDNDNAPIQDDDSDDDELGYSF